MIQSYAKKCAKIIGELNCVPKLLLHSCCGPCSTSVLEYLSQYFEITVFYYNPNIYPEEEYTLRLKTQHEVLAKAKYLHPVSIVEGDYEPDEYYEAVAGCEDGAEGGLRCEKCFRLRLGKTARYAKQNGYDYFTTTLTVSPHKNARLLNKIGEEIANEIGIKFLPSDFKKRDGFLRSTVLATEFDLYRQTYCGCKYSLQNDK